MTPGSFDSQQETKITTYILEF